MSSIAFNARNGLTVGTVATPVIDASGNIVSNSISIATPLPVASGGTGVGTITGILKGSGTNALVAATAGTDYVSPTSSSAFTVKQSFAAGSASVSGSINIPATSSGNTPISGDLYGTGTGLEWHNGTVVKQISYADGTNSSGTWSISITGSSNTSTTSTNIASGAAGSIPFQTSAGTTTFLPIGANTYVMTSSGTAPQWTALSGISAGTATTAGNLANGAAGQIPYQTGVSATSFTAAGTSGQILVSGGVGSPTWTSTPSVSTLTSTVTTGTAPFTVTSTTPVANLSIGGNAATATSATSATTTSNIAGGVLGSMPYQSATNTTLLVSGNTTTTKNFLTQTGTGTASAAPVWGTISQADVGGLTTASSPTFQGITLSGSSAATVINASETWNAAGTVFTGIKLNIINTASATGSMLFLLQNASTGVFSVDPLGNVIVGGNLTINGTTTTINSATITVDDINIVLGAVTTPTDTTAVGGGVTLLGTTNKTITWNSTANGWESSENIQLASGKTYRINGVDVLTATGLGTGILASSLTSVGTLTGGTWNAGLIAGQYGGTGVNNSGKTITLGGNLTTAGAFATTLTITAGTNVTLPTTGTLSTLAGAEALSNKTITASAFNGTVGATTPSTGAFTSITGSTNLVLNNSSANIYMDTVGTSGLGIKKISCNDGTGNWNFYGGLYPSGLNLLYETTNDGGASYNINFEAAQGSHTWKVYAPGTAGATGTANNTLLFDNTGLTLNAGKIVLGPTGSITTSYGLSTNYGVTSGINTGAYNCIMGLGAFATWLLSGTSGGVFRGGIQILDAGGVLRIYEGVNYLNFAAGALSGMTTVAPSTALYAPSGDTVTVPGHSWSAETNTGFYRVAVNQIGVSLGGTLRATFSPTGLSLPNAVVVNAGSSFGYGMFTPGNSISQSAHIDFYAGNGTRQGYIGASATSVSVSDTGTIPYQAGTHSFGGNITCNSSVAGTTLVSTVATGTAPFTVTSTTPVANLSIGGSSGSVSAGSNVLNSSGLSIVNTPTLLSSATSSGNDGVLQFINTFSTSVNKYIRLGSNNNLEFVNSGNTTVIASLTDTGVFVPNALTTNTGGNITVGSGGQLLSYGGGGIGTNFAAGAAALSANTTGTQNTAVGYQALTSVTSNGGCTAIGYQALKLTTGVANTAVGTLALPANTTGPFNTAMGCQSLLSNTTGGNNTAVGYGCMQNAVSVSNVVAIGYQAAVQGGGSNCVAIGYSALFNSVVGNNTAVGYSAGSVISSGQNDTVIGYSAQPSSGTVSNEITLGNSSIATLRCQVTSITALSDVRDKTNIKPLPFGIDFINTLRPVEFTWNTRDGAKVGIEAAGFIAQELKQAQEESDATVLNLVYESNPEKLEATYGNLLPVMVQALKDLSKQNKELMDRISALESK